MAGKTLRTVIGRRAIHAAIACVLTSGSMTGAATAFTVFSTEKTPGGAGTFFGPGKLPDARIFDVMIRNVIFTGERTFVTPFLNNGADGPFVTGEIVTKQTPNGMLSDNTTTINVNADTGPFELGGMQFLAVIAGGADHAGEQVSVMHDGTLIMTMDLGLDMGIGAAGVVKFPFYGTTGEVTLPYSLQTQMGLPGGTDRAGSMASGTKIHGFIAKETEDGYLDGAIVVAGNMPLNSIFMPGAPYALIRKFRTDMPVDGQRVGKLLGSVEAREAIRAKADLRFPEDSEKFRIATGPNGNGPDVSTLAATNPAGR